MTDTQLIPISFMINRTEDHFATGFGATATLEILGNILCGKSILLTSRWAANLPFLRAFKVPILVRIIEPRNSFFKVATLCHSAAPSSDNSSVLLSAGTPMFTAVYR